MNGKITALVFVLALGLGAVSRPAPAQFLTATPCSALNAQSAAIGARCSTGPGGEFRRYVNPMSGALGWLDLGDGGKVWYDGLKINTAQPEAAKFCTARPGQNAPALDDLARAGARGLREVFRNNLEGIKNPLLWSAEMDETSHGQRAVGYALENGDFHSALINQPFDNAVIICVGPPQALR